MPHMDGVTATQKIKERYKGSSNCPKIVAVTAHAMRGDEKKYLDAGLDAYIPKPYKIEDLIKQIPSFNSNSEVA